MTYNFRDPWENRLCCVGAAAAVAATVATVAAVGMQVAKSAGAFGPEGGASGAGGAAGVTAAGYLAPGVRETLFGRSTQDILDAERGILDDSISQGKLLEPEMYKALGLQPKYDRPEDPDLPALSQALSDRRNAFDMTKARLSELQQSTPGKGLKGKAHQDAVKAKKKEIRQLKKEVGPAALKELSALQATVEQRSAVGRKVVGFEAIPGVSDPTGSTGGAFGGALNEFNTHLAAALAGKEPIDPTLKTTFDERERTLRERLRRQMGPDYETSTAGSNALANFDREKSEAFAAYNRQSIEGYSKLAEGRAGALAALTSSRLQNLSYPAVLRGQLGQQLGGLAASREQVSKRLAADRGVKGEAVGRAAQQKDAVDAQARLERQQALENVLAGVSGAASTVGSLGGAGVSAALYGEAMPTGVEGPVTAGYLGAGGQFSPSAGTLFGR